MRPIKAAALILCSIALAGHSAFGQQAPSRPPPTPTPSTGTLPVVPQAAPPQTPGGEIQTANPNQDLSKVPLLSPEKRPVPPVPPMTRVGVNGAPLSLSLNEAIRRALESNRDIEVARDNVRLNETNLNALESVYDPVFQFTPQFNRTDAPTT